MQIGNGHSLQYMQRDQLMEEIARLRTENQTLLATVQRGAQCSCLSVQQKEDEMCCKAGPADGIDAADQVSLDMGISFAIKSPMRRLSCVGLGQSPRWNFIFFLWPKDFILPLAYFLVQYCHCCSKCPL